MQMDLKSLLHAQHQEKDQNLCKNLLIAGISGKFKMLNLLMRHLTAKKTSIFVPVQGLEVNQPMNHSTRSK